MGVAAPRRFSRIFGDEAVLARLERLGKNPRTFPNLVSVGFPERQLHDARRWYLEEATSAVERYAGRRMAEGFFEDEALLALLCRFFECTDWKLEGSPWFFSPEDYRRCFRALVGPVQFHSALLEKGEGAERWDGFFLKLPFDLGMEQAKRALWEELCRAEYYWKPLRTYAHLRAEALFGYLTRTLNILDVNPERYNYHWEAEFRERFQRTLRRFEQRLEAAVRLWQELRRERREERYRFRAGLGLGRLALGQELVQAFALLELDPARATVEDVRRAFRRKSKGVHPDHGGSEDAFKRLARYTDLVEAWINRHADA